MLERILVVDDDAAFRGMLREALEARGWDVVEAGDAETGIRLVAEGGYDIVLHDVRLPGMDGIEALEHLHRADPLVDIIVMTAFASRDCAVEALQHGAYDYFTKPFSLGEMEVVVRRALEKRRLQHEVQELRRSLGNRGPSERIIGQSPAMRRVVELIERVAPLDANVLVTGETGTGKELISDTIHALSQRASGPFIKLNCAAIPENLLESELFGHEKGAFTGASATKKGKFELGQGGTILLDEIGDMPLHLQPKLLRAVEQKQVERLGGSRPVSFDVRIIAATNQNLAERVQEKQFRSDLFYRLNVASIPLPSLRERMEDIPLLCEHFLLHINRKLGTDIRGVSKSGTRVMFSYHWPGNVRQLANTLERAAIFCRGGVITDEDMNTALQRSPTDCAGLALSGGPDASPAHRFTAEPGGESGGAPGIVPASLPMEGSVQLKDALHEFERDLILNALRHSAGVQTEAAKRLGVTPKNLWNKLQKHGIDPNNLDD